ncbi:hypothetical protein [Stakelama saccharophila]|uniref:Uncharacterized protein n=1 Tax=Stakelama saccharophila TaxID=3075605 RepID=A0ABZ0B5A7_9SPHN|nr:hypothetical protein [Stakelama sp. W311]WNO52558.1 hypothetical protein RPR59_08725 [Stakelama sp. W311]
MSDETPPPERPRWRRWLTLGEILAVFGLLISGLTLWNNVAMRHSQEDARAKEAAREAKAKEIAEREQALVSFNGTMKGGGDVLALQDMADHGVQSIDVRFPPSLGLPVRQAMVQPQIEAGWFEDKLLAITDGGPDAVEGRLPVAITASYWDGDRHRTDKAIYDVVFTTEGRILRSRDLKLRGVVLRQRIHGDAGPKLDTMWKAERKRLKSNTG